MALFQAERGGRRCLFQIEQNKLCMIKLTAKWSIVRSYQTDEAQ